MPASGVSNRRPSYYRRASPRRRRRSVRTLAVLGVALTCGSSSLPAQRAHQFEFGAFGSLTRYDKVFNLDSQIGGGGRLGYFFSNVVSAEFDAGYQSPNPKTGSAAPSLAHGSASLVLNFGTARNLFYILGGYSRLDFEKTAPYRFTDDAVHGAIGDRIFLGDRAALRFEVRGFYTPNTGFAGGDWAGHVVGSLGLSVFTRSGPAPDQDHDGVPDRRDACPDTPVGATVDARGCPTDSDRDGVYDGLDQCPGTPAGAPVNPSACPGTRVDAAGCPILFTPERTPVILRGVIFEIGKSALKPESFTVLDIVAQSLNANPDIRIEIAGYTDNTGSSATNLRLSQARADAVRAYLGSKGVAPSRMVAKGYGAANPIAANTTAAGRAQNRRVELHQLP